jgi:hypothetical protein
MSRRTAAWLAWSLCAVCVALIGLALLLDFLTDDFTSFLPGERPAPVFAVLAGVLSLAYPTVGALIATRLPANPIGWVFCGIGLLHTTQRFTMAYADYALLETLALPCGEYVAWFSTWLWVANPTLGVFLILLFPDGRLASRRWVIVAWAAICGGALTAVGVAFTPGNLFTHYYVDNPLGAVGVIGGGLTTYELFGASRALGMTLLLVSTLVAPISLILRLQRVRGDERQQLKWFSFAAVPVAFGLSLIILDLLVANVTYDFWFDIGHILPSWQVFRAVLYVEVFGLLFVPIFTYIAILRYNLYDIDVIVNRTLVYGSLTVMLLLVYFGGVTATQAVFTALTGQAERSQLAIVVSTLVIAALFTPLRRAIQSFIDRRFYRSKYDARKTLEAFSATLREETDLEALNDNLVGVVRETMQPAHASLWLRPNLPTERKRRARISRQAQRLVHSLSGVLIHRKHLVGVSRASRIAEQL